MSARDELAELIGEAADGWLMGPSVAGTSPEGVAADAVLAAGYRKPRTITTAEELDALEVTAVIRGKWLAEKWADPEGEMWHVAGKGMNWDTEQLIQRGALPATVLYEPEAAS